MLETPELETDEKWLRPTPLTPEISHGHAYPVDALPGIVQDAVSAYQQYGQQPLSLIASSALANVSLACQTLANVARDKMLVSPVSLYFLSVAQSGERKTQVDNSFGQAIRLWEQKMREQIEPHLQLARTLRQTWLVEKQGLLSQIRRDTLSGENTHETKHRYIHLCENEPSMPVLPNLFFEDATQETLAFHLANGWPSASIWSDEGGLIIGGQGMAQSATKFIALLNRLWDGKPFTAHRKTSQSFVVTNRRLTTNIMMQPLILQQMLAKNSGIARQSGFLARNLMVYPQSAMGKRFYQEPPDKLTALPSFHQQLTQCLDASLSLGKEGCLELPTLYLSPAAKRLWVNFFNDVEQGLQKPSQWSSIKDFASKAAENVARLAALFHLFDGKDGDISYGNTEQAIQVIRWHLVETRRILGNQYQTEQQGDAVRLLEWLLEKRLQITSPRHLQQYGPIRDKNRRNKAIQLLIEHHYLRAAIVNNTTQLSANPFLRLNNDS